MHSNMYMFTYFNNFVGRQSDGDGNLINWWDEGTISNYVEKATCFINQYGEYTAEEANNLKVSISHWYY